ncbi:MAG: hypothetical protein LBT46_01340 [Planctomycetaceae bacterium]|jgi:hypothetical protein|nr:hypothetical protein [Planctomycetaceae bacterium]
MSKTIFRTVLVALFFTAFAVFSPAARSETGEVTADPDYIALLQKRLAAAEKKAQFVNTKASIGGVGGSVADVRNAGINVAAAKSALYQAAGETKKHIEALEEKLKLCKERTAVWGAVREAGSPNNDFNADVDAQLAVDEAEYELKQAKKKPVPPASPAPLPATIQEEEVIMGKPVPVGFARLQATPGVRREMLEHEVILAEIKLIALRAERKALDEQSSQLDKLQSLFEQKKKIDSELKSLNLQLDALNSSRANLKNILKEDDPRLQALDKSIETANDMVKRKYRERAAVDTQDQRTWELDIKIRAQEVMVEDFKAKMKE